MFDYEPSPEALAEVARKASERLLKLLRKHHGKAGK